MGCVRWIVRVIYSWVMGRMCRIGELFFCLMIRRPPRSTQRRSSAASDVYKRQLLELEIENLPPEESKWLVGLESIEEVLVDGEPAALVRGGWHADTKQWENPEILHLYIPHKGQTYIFSSMEKDIPVDELIRMAESLP